MLRVQELQLNDFGPYRGVQKIEFNDTEYKYNYSEDEYAAAFFNLYIIYISYGVCF